MSRHRSLQRSDSGGTQTPVRRSPHSKHPKRGHHQANTPSRPVRLQKALQAVDQGMSIRVAAYTYNVRRSTLAEHKMKGNMNRVGRPTELSLVEETAITDHLLVQAEWGFPLTKQDVQYLIKDFLDSKRDKQSRFRDNLPGQKWIRSFLQRHENLQSRLPRHISSARSKLSPAVVKKYFDNLEKTIADIPPASILNFDETSMADNPSLKAVMVRRGEKYPLKILNSSKSAMSVMFAGTAAGELLPPYVVYKSKEMSENWTVGGPPGTRYNRTKSGWFDKEMFADWFETLVVPWAKRTDGKKVIIGDNVSSHFSKKVFDLCAELNILFVCLPPNSTHLLQPLDVAFFGPLKSSWKQILLKWKSEGRNRNLTLPKTEFPKLLNKLMIDISGRCQRNLKTAFRATGIHPLDRDEALKRIPGGKESPSREAVYQQVSESFVKQLETKRYGEERPARRGRTLRVSPGKSYALPSTSTDLPEEEENVDSPEVVANVSAVRSASTPNRTVRHGRRRLAIPPEPAAQPPQKRQRGQQHGVQQDEPQTSSPERERDMAVEPRPGDWVLVKFAGKTKVNHSVGKISGINADLELDCKFLRPAEKGTFMWPKDEVVKSVDYSDIQHILKSPKKLKRKGVPLKFEFNFDKFSLI